jgi:hypothetical protein
MSSDKRASAGERASAGLKLSVPQMPGMDHVRPNFQSHWDVCRPCRARETSGVIEQRFGRTHLDQ